MRTTAVIAVALAACAGMAQAQNTSTWAYFEPDDAPLQAGVVSPEGAQLILKCDEPGRRSVYAVIVSPTPLRGSTTRPEVRSIWLTFDAGNRREFRWNYYESSVVAMNSRRDRNLAPFLHNLVEAEALEVRFDPEDAQPFNVDFAVTGARDAIDRVFESCEDESVLD